MFFLLRAYLSYRDLPSAHDLPVACQIEFLDPFGQKTFEFIVISGYPAPDE